MPSLAAGSNQPTVEQGLLHPARGRSQVTLRSAGVNIGGKAVRSGFKREWKEYLEWSNSYREKVGRWLLRAGGRGREMGNHC